MLKADTDHYFYGYTLNNNGQLERTLRRLGKLGNARIRRARPLGCPFEPTNERPCFYETDIFNWIAREEMLATPAEQPFYLQVDYTAPHGDFRRPAGPEPATRHNDWFQGARVPHNRSEGFDEGNVSDKPRFIREADHLSPNEKRTYKVYTRSSSSRCGRSTTGSKRSSTRSASCTACATPTSSSPPTTASSSASTA